MNFEKRYVHVGGTVLGNDRPFVLISGPCQIESRQHTLDVAGTLARTCKKLEIPFIFKASFDKANRTSSYARRGIGLAKGLKVLEEVKKNIGCPVLTDVHEVGQCSEVAGTVDVIQIPAFLCRQTDLITAAGKTGKPVNIKKGQFLAPWDMKNIVEKLNAVGNLDVLLTERGTSFGYNTLVCDMRALPQMATTGCPVVFDATHSVQQPGGLGGASGGDRRFAPVLARSAMAVGIAGLFLETHEDPDNAPSDGPNMIYLKDMESILSTLREFDDVAKRNILEIK